MIYHPWYLHLTGPQSGVNDNGVKVRCSIFDPVPFRASLNGFHSGVANFQYTGAGSLFVSRACLPLQVYGGSEASARSNYLRVPPPISRLRSEKTGELDPETVTVGPEPNPSETPSEQVKKVGGELVNQQQDVNHRSPVTPGPCCQPSAADGSGVARPGSQQKSAIA